jgi:hypothetical protein
MDCFRLRSSSYCGQVVASLLAMTLKDTQPRSRGMICPKFCKSTSPSKSEGAGKTGCALHPRSHVRFAQKSVHMSIQVQRRASGLPCAMVLRLIRCRPGDRLSCHHHRFEALASSRLDASTGASDPTDFAVRRCCARLSQHPRPSLPVPRWRRWPTPLLRDRMAGVIDSICPTTEAIYF